MFKVNNNKDTRTRSMTLKIFPNFFVFLLLTLNRYIFGPMINNMLTLTLREKKCGYQLIMIVMHNYAFNTN